MKVKVIIGTVNLVPNFRKWIMNVSSFSSAWTELWTSSFEVWTGTTLPAGKQCVENKRDRTHWPKCSSAISFWFIWIYMQMAWPEISQNVGPDIRPLHWKPQIIGLCTQRLIANGDDCTWLHLTENANAVISCYNTSCIRGLHTDTQSCASVCVCADLHVHGL